MSVCKLFCLPYAGGSSLVFSDWRSLLSSNIEIVPIELNGRGQLLHRPFYHSTQEASEDIIQRLHSYFIDDTPYCFFGQSLGGLIIYDILEMLQERGLPLPFHVFFSAIFPPHINKVQNKLHEFSDAAFIKQLKKWSSLPKTLIEDPQMIQAWAPILKADYRLLENYHFNPTTYEFPIDFTILKGKWDNWLSEKEYKEWDRYSNRKIDFYEIDGGHLFIHEQKHDVISIINTTINEYL